jgi:maltooligosyltrehalose trehalohydrolase
MPMPHSQSTNAQPADLTKRRYPIGAELLSKEETHFRVWAPKARAMEVVLANGEASSLEGEGNGYYSGAINAAAGTLYQFRLAGSKTLLPDPASRYQPEGSHGPSCIVDPSSFRWSDAQWAGVELAGQVCYEFHVGTFTPEGTWRAAAETLPLLKEDGITLLEMMPISDFPGQFGWGYDGVNLFAPCHLYGSPNDLRYFIDYAHSLGMGVIIDVVYNHFGPDGNYLCCFSDDYVTKDKPNEWGDCINFDGKNSQPVREFFIANACYWIAEFHFDGFRFDATQSIHDSSGDYIVGAIARAARAAAGKRSLLLVAENEPQQTKLIRPPAEGGDGLDGLWNDDWHHSAIVALTGRNEAYYTDYKGTPQEFVSAAKYGYLFQGQPYAWQAKPRGTPTLGTRPESYFIFLENHDQVSNCAFGRRVLEQTSPGRYRALTALMLLSPSTPLLFQGQEFGATNCFQYFTDVGDNALKEAVRKGRLEFLSQFPSAKAADAAPKITDPSNPETFLRSKLDWSERNENPLHLLHRDLLRLRRDDDRFSRQAGESIDGAVLTPNAFLLRYFSKEPMGERLLLVNLGPRTTLSPLPEPLAAPPLGHEWKQLWSSNAVRYGGTGITEVIEGVTWILPAEAAVVLSPARIGNSKR